MMMPTTNISASCCTPSTTATATATATAAAGGSSCPSPSAKLKGVMLHQHQHQHQQQDLQQHGAAAVAAAAALKCPRCDSSNTKFCYYNNYSLSQPRHFCKACKRYWTRGGTLRNVPVGGGCRKNKRVRKSAHRQQSSSAAAAASTGSATVAADPLQQQPPRSSSLVSNLVTSATNDLSSFMYSDMNLGAFSTASTAAYEALGLGGLIPSNQLSAAGLISNNLADLQHQTASFLNNDYSTSFGSQAASLLVSSLKQPKTAAEYQSSLPYDASANLGFLKDVKAEGDNNLMGNNNISSEWQDSYQFEANNANDASYLYWNSAMSGAGGWPDAANPSVAPLI